MTTIKRTIDVEVKTGNSESVVNSLDNEIKKLSADTKLLADTTEKSRLALKKFEDDQKALGNTVNKLGVVYDKTGNAVTNLSNDYLKLRNSASTANKALKTALTPAAAGVKNSLNETSQALGGVGRSAGMAGIQVQQFVGQLQGGQNTMVALSQQGADLGFVLGVPLLGAVVGIAASAIGMASAFGEVKVEMEETDEIVKILINDFSKLDDEQKKIARKLITSNIKTQGKALDKLKASYNEVLTSLRLFSTGQSRLDELENINGNILLQEQSIKKLNEQYIELLQNTSEQSTVWDDATNSISDIIVSTQVLADTYGMSTVELADYELRLLGANEAQRKAVTVSLERIQTLKAEEDAIKKVAAAELSAGKFGDKLAEDTQRLQIELALREQVEQGYISQHDADLSARFLSNQMKQEAALQTELDMLGENNEAKLELTALFNERQLLAHQAYEDSLTGQVNAATEERVDIESTYSDQVTAMRMGVVSNAVGLLRSLVGDSKAGAIALIAVQKGLAIGEVLINSQVASVRALAELGPIAGPPVAAKMLAYGKVSAGLIAATGIAEASSAGSGSSGISSSSATSSAATEPTVTQDFQADSVIEDTALTDLANELRNLDPDAMLSVEYTRRLYTSLVAYTGSGQI